ncbi:hypothetical protein [Elizabethkingia miricola]|uniref:hypothetical protein n=2 Tax=Elizabethkingia TaxID=308865 RepID=UPI00074170CE|nr:hypothetical protein [Elizabethkingia miricola]KUG10257.1 hypothetical protein AMC91_18855 [Elizabethkingia miricola]MCL1655854.1 hypothetical protein [Elizabethkingia miricola]
MSIDQQKAINFGKCPEYITEKLKPLEDNIAKKIIKRLNRENDRNNYISTLAELRFISIFNEYKFKIEYEKKYKFIFNEQTPDITLEMYGNKIIAEIYRLGSSETDYKIELFIDKVSGIINEIESNNVLLLEFKNESINIDSFDFNNLNYKIQEWFQTKPTINSILDYNSDINFKIMYESKIGATQLISDPVFLTIKSQKVIQDVNLSHNEITKKIIKYRELIKAINTPFFLCIEIDLISGFNFLDIKERFHHSGAEVGDYEKHKQFYTQSGKGKCWSILGDFYNYSFLSGIFISFNNEYKLLMSPLKKQIIYQKQYSETLKFLTDYFNTNIDK